MAKTKPAAASNDPTRLSVRDLAALLTRAGGKIDAAAIEADLAARAPRNADGTIHLLHYAAWLASQVD